MQEKTGNAAWDSVDRREEFNYAEVNSLMETPGTQLPYRGWRIRWTGWRRPVDQLIEFGVWVATRDDDESIWYSTTQGVVARLGHPYNTIDMSFANDAKPLIIDSYVRKAVAQAALERLYERLKTLG